MYFLISREYREEYLIIVFGFLGCIVLANYLLHKAQGRPAPSLAQMEDAYRRLGLPVVVGAILCGALFLWYDILMEAKCNNYDPDSVPFCTNMKSLRALFWPLSVVCYLLLRNRVPKLRIPLLSVAFSPFIIALFVLLISLAGDGPHAFLDFPAMIVQSLLGKW